MLDLTRAEGIFSDSSYPARPMSTPNLTSRPLSEIFQDDWYKFTEDSLDPRKVNIILENQYAPANAAHSTTIEGLEAACTSFMEVNGDALFKALEHLNHKQ